MTERKATDVLLDLERKTDLLLKIITDQSHTIKMILGRLNETCQMIESKKPPRDELLQTFTDFKPIEIDSQPKGARRTSRPETVTPQTNSKVPVFQTVHDPNGKSIYMADVEVITPERNLIIKTRTNATGKWHGALLPGKYTVNIIKRENNNRKRLSFSQEIEILSSQEPFELEMAKLA